MWHQLRRLATGRAARGPGRFAVYMFSLIVMGAAFGADPQAGLPVPTPDEKEKSDERKLGRRLIRRTTTGSDEDVMERIIRLMGLTARRLEIEFDTGEETQALQQNVLKQLDDAIKLAASQTRKTSGGQSTSTSDRRRREKPDRNRQSDKRQNKQIDPDKSQTSNAASAGQSPPTDGATGRGNLAESRRGWGNLPQRERDEVIQGAEERYLERYRKWIEQYYRALQEADE